MDFVVIIHGGAGVISRELDGTQYRISLKNILLATNEYIKNNSHIASFSAVDVVEFAVQQLELEPLFNAGRGAVYTDQGTHELEACIMDGRTRDSGSVSLIKTIKSPIAAARVVMECTHHRYLAGDAAEAFVIKERGLEVVDQTYYDTERRLYQLHQAQQAHVVCNDHDLPDADKTIEVAELAAAVVAAADANTPTSITTETASSAISTFPYVYSQQFLENMSESDVKCAIPSAGTKHSDAFDLETETVGCVCMYMGHVAAATSTGGMTNKLAGRIGDTPIVGAGTYADDVDCAVSATGKGEEFMRCVAAYDIAAGMKIGHLSLIDAVNRTVHGEGSIPPEAGGVIAVDAAGNYAMEFNSKGMFRGMFDSAGKAFVAIWEEEEYFRMN